MPDFWKSKYDIEDEADFNIYLHPCRCACRCNTLQELPEKWQLHDPMRLKYIQVIHLCYDCRDRIHTPVVPAGEDAQKYYVSEADRLL